MDAVTSPATPSASMAGIIWRRDRKSTRLNSSHITISYAVFCLKKKTHGRLDRRAVLRVRHVDGVDDDEPAAVAQPPLMYKLLHVFESVRRERFLEPRAGTART